MNKLLVIVIILVLMIGIAIGLKAIYDDINPQSSANIACPEQEFPDNKRCPNRQKIQLVKDKNGCFVFTCK